jgi:6-phosphogluconate dehydrogenase
MNYGLIGIGVMGQNLALNMEGRGFPVAVHDRDPERIEDFLRGKASGRAIAGAATLDDLIRSLDPPRRVRLLVTAGRPVDDVIAGLRPLLAPGDVIIDGGNSHFLDTERREAALAGAGIYFVGSGISGGEEGALKGPSLMPGGAPEAYALIAPMMTAIAARVEGEPCCAHMGPRGAGHYVKMIHNGIEYGLMQLIGEAYDILRTAAGLRAPEVGALFAEWNRTAELNSYLVEITARVLAKIDPATGRPLVDVILDTAEQKGTGKWTSQSGFDVGVPIPTINAAVEARLLSGLKEARRRAARILPGPAVRPGGAPASRPDDVRQALFASMIVTFAQGMDLLRAASREYGYGLNLERIVSIWRGGCIIRSKILAPVGAAFRSDPGLANLMTDGFFSRALAGLQESWRSVVATAVGSGIPVPALGASLAYYDAYRCERLPANLLQAQRDLFGAHTYRRVDKDGVFHTDWGG